MTYDNYLAGNLLMINLVLAVVAGGAAWWLATRLPRGWVMGVVGVPIVIIGSMILSALNVLVWLIGWGGTRVLEPLATNVGGGLSFYWESGIEFGLLGFAAELIAYIVGRVKFRARAIA